MRPTAAQHRHSKSRLTAVADTAPQQASEAARTRSRPASSTDMSPAQAPAPQRRHIITPDPVALIYLEGDPSVNVVERRICLEGYELYLVEQWACSRQSPTLVISTYTGDPNHSVVVGVLSVPADDKDWSPQLRIYFKTMQQYHARPKETQFGEIMATNLSSFPSALTVIAVPDGDLGKHRHDFIVNEDLKRLGCSGRSALTLLPPTRATQEKFQSLYKTSDKIPFAESVLELIKMCQTALYIFGLLGPQYIDGLLCDLTEKAINDWWTDVGVEYYKVEPADGILGPTTVAALLGMLMGARNRLAWYGAPVAKDVFDLEATAKGIDSFQKACKLKRSRRLDHETLRKLHSISAKAAAGEGGWGVQKAVKSTMEGIGGKRGEIVIGMVGGKDRGNIGDIETADMDKFSSLISGERAKWLWYGKPRRAGGVPAPSGADLHVDREALFGREEVEETGVTAETDGTPQKKDDRSGVYLGAAPESAASVSDGPGDRERDRDRDRDRDRERERERERDRDVKRKTVFKSVAGKVNDARSGLGRIRDAVGGGLRGHAARPSRDEAGGLGGGSFGPHSGASVTASPGVVSGAPSTGLGSLGQPSNSAMSSPTMVGRAFTWKNKPEEYLNALRKEREKDMSEIDVRDRDDTWVPAPLPTRLDLEKRQHHDMALARASILAPTTVPGLAPLAQDKASQLRRSIASTAATSAAGSVADEADLQGPILEAERTAGPGVVGLLRRHSIAVGNMRHQRPCEVAWLRRLSFSAAEEAVLRWQEIADVGGEEEEENDEAEAANAALSVASLTVKRCLYQRMAELRDRLGPVVTERVLALEALDVLYAQQVEEAQGIYVQLSEVHERLQLSSQELLGMERAQATEAIREVEMLMARVEYEIGALASKVQDVEDGVQQFAEQVDDVERRADELKRQLETESWVHWLVRTLTGIGTGPNIIQDRRM